MTTEYMLEPGQSHEELARDLLEQAGSPDQVHWSPRPDVYGGGVYVLADSGIAERTRQVRMARRAEEAQRIEASLAAAEERDSDPAVADGTLTPDEAGFAPNAGTDPGSAGAAQANAEAVAAGQTPDAPVDAAQSTDATATPDAGTADATGEEQDESKMTPAQKRAAAKRAKQATAADATEGADATEEKSE